MTGGIGIRYLRPASRVFLTLAAIGGLTGLVGGASRTPALTSTTFAPLYCEDTSLTCDVRFIIRNPNRPVRSDSFQVERGSGLKIVSFRHGTRNEFYLKVDFSDANPGSWGILYEGDLHPDLLRIE